MFAGVYPGYKGLPFENTVVDTGPKVKLGYQAKTSSGYPTTLLSIKREEVDNDLNNPGPNFNDFSKSNPKGIQKTDKPLLEQFIRHLQINGADTLESLKSKLSKLSPNENLRNFTSYVLNGAFFKHWADHYAEQAKKMAKSLGL